MKHNVRIAAWIGNLIVFILLCVVMAFSLLQPLDRAMLSSNMSLAKSQAPDERILIIAIDEETLQELGAFNTWTRDRYVKLLEHMYTPTTAPAAVGFDILFASTSTGADDQALAEALSQYSNIIFPSYAEMETAFTRYVTNNNEHELLQPTGWTDPLPLFAQYTQRAHMNARLDSDGVIRRTWLQLGSSNGTPMPSLAYRMAELGGADPSLLAGRNTQAEMLIDYQMLSGDFWTVSFADVYRGDFPAENFDDMLVLIGFTAAGYDTGSTTIESEMKPIYVHANILHQLFSGKWLQEAPAIVGTLSSLLVFILMIFAAWRLSVAVSAAFALLMGALLFGVQYASYHMLGIHFNVVDPALALFLTYLVNVLIKFLLENRQRVFITKQFGRYLSPDLVKDIAQSNKEMELGGINKELTMLFLDIRGFTELSEKLLPQEVVKLLNTMFDIVTKQAFAHLGTVDKFMGDAAMILYNAPLDVDKHAYCAVRTAWEIQQELANIRDELFDRYGVRLSVGIGIHTGEVVVGYIGSSLRVDYTAIGDNVNIAARIESITSSDQILVSEETYKRTSSDFSYRFIGERVMKGKSIPIGLYEVLGVTDGEEMKE